MEWKNQQVSENKIKKGKMESLGGPHTISEPSSTAHQLEPEQQVTSDGPIRDAELASGSELVPPLEGSPPLLPPGAIGLLDLDLGLDVLHRYCDLPHEVIPSIQWVSYCNTRPLLVTYFTVS